MMISDIGLDMMKKACCNYRVYLKAFSRELGGEGRRINDLTSSSLIQTTQYLDITAMMSWTPAC